MIPSDHFVRFYNEVFKALMELGPEHLIAYWRELGRLQSAELSERFRKGGLQACYEYWSMIRDEENCGLELTLYDDHLHSQMHRCPSLSKAMDNDAGVCELYCDHCMAWMEPALTAAGLHVVKDMISRTEPRCQSWIFEDPAKTAEFAKRATLRAQPYDDPEVERACERAQKVAKERI